jgi:hypothetical protein
MAKKPSVRSNMQPDGSLKCAKCGGTQFEAKRSTGRKVMWGVASLAGTANEVHCMCGAKYVRE